MTTARERYVRYCLRVTQEHQGDWSAIEGPQYEQIHRAWEAICGPSALASELEERERLVLEYIEAIDEFHQMRGVWRESLDWLKRGLSAARLLGRRKYEGTLLNSIAWCYDVLGKPHRALEVCQQALIIRRELKDRDGEAVTLENSAGIYYDLGNLRRALEMYEQALVIRETGAEILVGITSWGDMPCVATGINYRVDIPETLDFIDEVISGL